MKGAKYCIVSLAFLMLIEVPAYSQQGKRVMPDLSIDNMIFYGIFKADDKGGDMYFADELVRVAPFEKLRHQIEEVNWLNIPVPDQLEIEVTLQLKNATKMKDLKVILGISLELGYYIPKEYDDGYHVTSPEDNAEWFAPIVLLRQDVGEIETEKPIKVLFKEFELAKIKEKFL
jgi:hypothetical protein